MEAGKLRRRLEAYYLGAGRDDPVRIEIPKGGYVPTFSRQPDAARGRGARARRRSGCLVYEACAARCWVWPGSGWRRWRS